MKISVAYLDPFGAIQQTIFTNNQWSHSLLYPSSSPPANTTRLCSFTNLLSGNRPECAAEGPKPSNASSGTPANPCSIIPYATWDPSPPLSAVVMYENTNRTLSMVNALPVANLPEDPHTNPDLALQFLDWTDLLVGTGFSCNYNAPNSTGESNLYVRLTLGDQANVSPNPGGSVYFADAFWTYDSSAVYSQSEVIQQINPLCRVLRSFRG